MIVVLNIDILFKIIQLNTTEKGTIDYIEQK